MAEITRHSGCCDWIDVVLWSERTHESVMKLDIRIRLADISFSYTVSTFDSLGVERSRKAISDWVQKADLQSVSGKAPNQVAVDETVVRINYQWFWLYAAANPQTNE
jgi:putative transposase